VIPESDIERAVNWMASSAVQAAQARANTIKTVADAELSRAKTAETLAKTGEIDQNMALTATEAIQQAALGEQVQPVVR